MEHPPNNALRAYCAGYASVEDTQSIESHLADCSDCAFLVSHFVREEFAESRSQVNLRRAGSPSAMGSNKTVPTQLPSRSLFHARADVDRLRVPGYTVCVNCTITDIYIYND
jgi:hypothetical protein